MKSVRTKSLITLIIIIVIAALASVWAFGWNGEGILIGYHRFLPWYSNVKLGQDIKGGVTILYEADTSGSEDYEADIEKNRISLSSPLAKALIGKEAGDTAEFAAPGGLKSFEIVDVIYQ